MDGAGWLSRFVTRNRLPLVVVLAVVVLGGLILWISDARGGGQQVGAAAPSVEYRQSAVGQRGGRLATAVPVPAPVMRILPALTQRGEQRFPEVYGGLRLTDRGTRVEVFLTTLDPATETAILGDAPASLVTFTKTPHSYGWLQALQQRIIADQPTLKAAGIQVMMWNPDYPSGREALHVLDLTPAKAAYLNNRYGAANVLLSEITPTEVPSAIPLTLQVPPHPLIGRMVPPTP